MLKLFCILIILGIITPGLYAITDIKFCVLNEWEMAKCEAFNLASTVNTSITVEYNIGCTLGKNIFDCMQKIKDLEADIMNLDVGLAFYAIQIYGMRAFAVENYNNETEPAKMNLKYTSNAVVMKNTIKEPKDLVNTAACFSGTGSSEGWSYPLARLIENNLMRITNCNNEVKTVNDYFVNGSCAPSSIQPDFNTLGDNGQLSCSLCGSQSENRRYCSILDEYAGSAGTLKCLKNAYASGKPSVAFLRGDVIPRMIARGDLNETDFELLCINKQADGSYVAPISKIHECNWGTPQSKMLMTKLTNTKIKTFKRFFELAQQYFGPDSSHFSNFTLFDSTPANYPISSELKLILGKSGMTLPPQMPYDLMFSDSTKNIYFPPDAIILNYFEFVDAEFKSSRATLTRCPVAGVKWCVIGQEELRKCADMKLALDSRQIRPEFFCVEGQSTVDCMQLISQGFADLMTLDAAEVYVGGKYLSLAPIAQEFYGDESFYYAVAIVKRADKGILISNWKYKKTCHSGAGKASGWIKPINIALDTVQMRVYNHKLIYAFSELIGRACIPGILSDQYNPDRRNPVNLCEICASGGADRCQPDARENYYGDSGAFRCMLESGDIAFARHTTVHENTDGRNLVDWARSRRSDDYELLCADGSRLNTYSWQQCNLGRIPGNMVVTGGFKSPTEREAMWKMLRYAQEYFSSDNNQIFSMFESPFGRSDLMFSDTAVSLLKIPLENQSYTKVLDRSFSREIENLEIISQSNLFSVKSANHITRSGFWLAGWIVTVLLYSL